MRRPLPPPARTVLMSSLQGATRPGRSCIQPHYFDAWNLGENQTFTSLFPKDYINGTDRSRTLIDCTPAYMMNPKAPVRLAAMVPQARIVMLVRVRAHRAASATLRVCASMLGRLRAPAQLCRGLARRLLPGRHRHAIVCARASSLRTVAQHMHAGGLTMPGKRSSCSLQAQANPGSRFRPESCRARSPRSLRPRLVPRIPLRARSQPTG